MGGIQGPIFSFPIKTIAIISTLKIDVFCTHFRETAVSARIYKQLPSREG